MIIKEYDNIQETELHKKPNYFLSYSSRNNEWILFPENGVEFIVVNNIDKLRQDADRYNIMSIKGIEKENTIYEWGYNGRFEKWTEVNSSNPDYNYLSQYLVQRENLIKHKRLMIRESGTNRSTLYHSVFNKRSLDFVLENGIIADDQGFVYLAEKPFDNAYATFIVTVPNEDNLYDWEDFWLDADGNEIDFDHEYNPNNKYYIYIGDIPLEYAEQVR